LFISYASVDRHLIAPLVELLRGEGWDVWWDRHLEAGETFDRRIEQELAAADAVIVVWSRASVQSNWVLSEAMVGFESNRLVPVALDARISPPLPFNRLHTVSLADWSGAPGHPGLEDLARGVRTTLESRGMRPAATREPLASRKPVVAVLPFDDLDATGPARPLCAVVPTRLIAALGRFSGLETLGRRTSFDPALGTLEARAIARALRADYVVTGSVCGNDGALMLSVELIEGESGRQSWSLALTPDDAGTLDPERAAEDIARALSGEFLQLSRSRARDGAARGDAHSRVEATRDTLLQSSRDAIESARSEAARAIATDPGNGHAHALLASAIAEGIVNGYATDLCAARAEARREAEQALTLCPDDHAVLKYAGHALAIAGEHEHGERVLRRALELNQYDDGARGYLGWVLAPSTEASHLAEARATFDRLLAGTQKHPGRPFWFLHRSVALTCAGDFDGALAAARVAVNFGPNLTLGWLHAANALGQLGRIAEAQALVERCPLDLKRPGADWQSMIRLISRDDRAAELRTAGLRSIGLAAGRTATSPDDDAGFVALMLRAGLDAADAGALWADVRDRYAEPARRYHTLDHLRHCLGQADIVADRVADADTLRLAIWFHDVVYEPASPDNEARSAAHARAALTPHLPAARVADIERLVLATRYGELPRSDDEAWIIDIDYSSFGLPWDEFLRDSLAVRAERPDLADDEFAIQQSRFLESLLARPSIYHTGFFRERCEARAKENIGRYLDLLRRTGAPIGVGDRRL
jgi:predicted metal-dependent HD superfamily phosphohydrolase/TolB-like protein